MFKIIVVLAWTVCLVAAIALADLEESCEEVNCEFGGRCELVEGIPECICPTVCPTIFSPVCGSDGITYGNNCLLLKARCKEQKNIVKVSNGRCSPSGRPPRTTFRPLPTVISPGIGVPKFTPLSE